MNSVKLPDYVLEQLHRIAKAKGFSEYFIEQENGAKNDDGYVGALLHITLSGLRNVDGEKKSDECSLTCKLLPENLTQCELFNVHQLFEREVEMYNNIFPIFTDFQLEKGLTDKNGFTHFPKCYFAISDPIRNQYAIIMDDFRAKLYTLNDKLKPMTFRKVRLIMIALGRFHGLSFALRDQCPQSFNKLKSMNKTVWELFDKSAVCAGVLHNGYERAINMFASEMEEEYLKAFRNSWKDRVQLMIKSNPAEPFCVLVHGDCWANNLMFKGAQVIVIGFHNYKAN